MTLPKLVRDHVPDLLRAQGQTARTGQATGKDLMSWTLQKLSEETAEVRMDPCVEELADVLEVLHALAALLGVSWECVERERAEKEATRGGFRGGTILEQVRSQP